ncbi:hypothetical protein C1H46_043784 [Malus baccata]|uniref:Uncharacterized protein n=1 Tax=Malus baccata TaxID=106549 RepID=A0A540K8Y5_MALBA|nr:hypothetical protein C1H46_043784 [Malus baccata]
MLQKLWVSCFLTRYLRHHSSTKLADSVRLSNQRSKVCRTLEVTKSFNLCVVLYTKKLNFDLCFGIPLLEFFDLGIVEVSGNSLTGKRIQRHPLRFCHETVNYSLRGKIN